MKKWCIYGLNQAASVGVPSKHGVTNDKSKNKAF